MRRFVLELLEESGGKDPESKDEDELRRACKRHINSLVRKGAASGCHCVLGAQRPDASILGGQVRNNIQARLVMGGMSPEGSQMALGSATAVAELPGSRSAGRFGSTRTDGRICYPGRMKLGRSLVVALAVGAVFGAAVSFINDVSSAYGTIGSGMAGTGLAWAAQVASRLLGVGWAWAGLGVAMGWLAGARARGAAAAVLALLAATTAYYGMDSVLRGEPFAVYWYEMLLRWWPASVVLGLVLGVVGASIGRPGVVGLLAGLTLPVGATVETIFLADPPMFRTPAEDFARVIVWVAAAVVAGVVVARFGARLSRPGPHAGSGRS